MKEIIYDGSVPLKDRISSLLKFYGKKGIWALYGKNTEGQEQCLNVGQSTDIGKEIMYDLGCLYGIGFMEDGTKKYINQFGEDCGFRYKSNYVRPYLYSFIALNYKSLKFVYICSDVTKECEYAQQNHALFWRNGHPYGIPNEVDYKNPDIQIIGSYFADGGETYSIECLLHKLEEDLGCDVIRGKKLINKCERLGFIYNMGDGNYTR